jgi:Ni/Co efflux regulator RcnB
MEHGAMGEKSESEDFEEDEAPETTGESEDLDVDHLMRDLDKARRRSVKAGEPAWRRLERYIEEKRTAEQVSDFDDYEIGIDGESKPRKKKKLRKH